MSNPVLPEITIKIPEKLSSHAHILNFEINLPGVAEENAINRMVAIELVAIASVPPE